MSRRPRRAICGSALFLAACCGSTACALCSYNSANTPEFSQKWGVPRLMVDQGGTLWISMVDGGMTTWDKHGFHSAFTSTNQPDRLLWSAPGRVIFVYTDGRLLSGRKTRRAVGLGDCDAAGCSAAWPAMRRCRRPDLVFAKRTMKSGSGMARKPEHSRLTAGLEGQIIKVLTADAQGRIWVGTDQSPGRVADEPF